MQNKQHETELDKAIGEIHRRIAAGETDENIVRELLRMRDEDGLFADSSDKEISDFYATEKLLAESDVEEAARRKTGGVYPYAEITLDRAVVEFKRAVYIHERCIKLISTLSTNEWEESVLRVQRATRHLDDAINLRDRLK